MYLNRIAALLLPVEHTLQSGLFAQAFTLRKNLLIVYIHRPSHHPELLTRSVVIMRVMCASLASRIVSAGMMKDRGPVGSGNCLSCRFKTLAPLEEYAS